MRRIANISAVRINPNAIYSIAISFSMGIPADGLHLRGVAHFDALAPTNSIAFKHPMFEFNSSNSHALRGNGFDDVIQLADKANCFSDVLNLATVGHISKSEIYEATAEGTNFYSVEAKTTLVKA